jgi:hypothetical protein
VTVERLFILLEVAPTIKKDTADQTPEAGKKDRITILEAYFRHGPRQTPRSCKKAN